MADFQAAKPLQHKLNQMTHHRKEESGDHYSRGIECLLLAEDDDFQDRALLLEACDCFMDAIRYNRQHTEAYVAMAYLLGLIGNPEQALDYTNEALRIDPEHADIPVLIRYLKGTPEHPQPKTVPLDNTPLGRMQARINGVLEELAAENLNAIAPALNELMVQRLAEKAQYWQAQCATLQQEIQALRDPQGNFLKAQLHPLQAHSDRYQTAWQYSQHMAELAEQLQENNAQVDAALAALAAGDAVPDTQNYVNTLLDNCDYFAETIEQWENAGWNVKSLNRQYETLCDQLEVLQDQLGL